MKLETAVILAGGPGNRLKPLTNDLPKAMIEIHGKPLLQWTIEWLRVNNVTKLILGVAYLKEKIVDYFGDGSKFGVNIKYSTHTVEGGTGEGFRLAIQRYVDCDQFFAMNSDQITNLNLRSLAGFHQRHNSIATIVVTKPRCPYGHIQVNKKRDAIGFFEKPPCLHAFCNAGIYAFNRQILNYLQENGNIEETAFPALSEKCQLKAYPLKGLFITVNTLKDMVSAEQELKKWKNK